MAPPPASIRWYAVVLALACSLLISPSTAIYCDEDDCYDLLGWVIWSQTRTTLPNYPYVFFLFTSFFSSSISRVAQSANASEIKKSYYKLSLKQWVHLCFYWIEILVFISAKDWRFIVFIFSHPDKNPDPESKKLFVKVANAYEVICWSKSNSLIVLMVWETKQKKKKNQWSLTWMFIDIFNMSDCRFWRMRKLELNMIMQSHIPKR